MSSGSPPDLAAASGAPAAGLSSPSIGPAQLSPARGMTADESAAWNWQMPAQMDDVTRLSWLLLRWRVDPIFFAVEALRIVLMPYQQQILLDLADAPAEVYAFHGLVGDLPKRQTLAPSGHGLGKTRVQAVAIWWHTLTHQFSRRIVTAPTGEQLTRQLWGEVRKMFRRLKTRWPMLANDWEIQSSAIIHKNPDFGDWITVARTARAEEPEALQGAHALDDDDTFGDLAALFQEDADTAPSGGIMVIIEEASGVDDAIRMVLQGALSEEGARLLACGNPTRPDGWFARDIDHTDRYAVHCLDCRMSDRSKVYTMRYRDFGGQVHEARLRGFVRPEYWQELLRDCDGDEDHDEFKVRVRGQKPHSAQQQVIKGHWVDEAMKRPPSAECLRAPGVLALDFGLTSDRHALAVRFGFAIREIDEWLPADTPDEITLAAVDTAKDTVERYGRRIRYVIGDSNGVGKGAMEVLTRYYREHPECGVTVIHFNAGAGAIDGRRYNRRRDEMWFKAGRAFFSDPRCSLLELPALRKQLTTPGYSEDTARRVKVESKHDIKRRTGDPSGNAADAALMTLMVPQREPAAEPAAAPSVWPGVLQRHFERLGLLGDARRGHLIA